MSTHNPELEPPHKVPPNEAIQPSAPDFIETPDLTPGQSGVHETLPLWLYVACGLALFLAGSSFTGFATFGLGLLDQGPGGPAISSTAGHAEVAETPMTIGKKIYNGNCANCHQASGEGQPGSYPPLGGSDWVTGPKDRLAAIMLHGVAGPIAVRGGSYGTQVMPGWATNFTDDKLAAVMTYLRASWGNTADAVTAEEVTAARTRFASHNGPWDEAELLKIEDVKK